MSKGGAMNVGVPFDTERLKERRKHLVAEKTWRVAEAIAYGKIGLTGTTIINCIRKGTMSKRTKKKLEEWGVL